MTKVYKGCIDIIEDIWDKEVDLRHKATKQWLNNLKLLIFYHRQGKIPSLLIKETIRTTLKKAYQTAEIISQYLFEEKGLTLNEDEKAYLAMEIEWFVQLCGVDGSKEKLKEVREGANNERELASDYLSILGGKANIKIGRASCRERVYGLM